MNIINPTQASRQALSCPLCRRSCVVPPGGVGYFPTNSTINTMADEVVTSPGQCQYPICGSPVQYSNDITTDETTVCPEQKSLTIKTWSVIFSGIITYYKNKNINH